VTVEEKALELVAENRVIIDGPLALVAGHHDHYRVEALDTGVLCSCPARVELCAHALAAMVRWNEVSQTVRTEKPW
jgi:hypothetical protein